MKLPSLMLAAALAALPVAAHADDWPPANASPHDEFTRVPFTVAWAKRLRGFQTLADLQRAAGANGMITERSLEGDNPRVSFHWVSEPSDGRHGYMRAEVTKDGFIGVGIVTVEQATFGQGIVVNNRGTFICPICNPPIDIEPPAGVESSSGR